ncbi:MAG: NADP-dependent oxidoreductase [Pseudomonadales bacterium]|jgi:NADPH-dependent curcumin reductase CurA|nr:NADP-dependent oxidoreductase [Pseudomonadales bacterium]
MSNEKNARWLVKSYPEQELSIDNFELVYEDVPEPAEGEVLIRTTSLVISPPLRMAVGTGGITGNVVALGSLMRGSGQAVVVESRHPGFEAGDLVSGAMGWQEYAVIDGMKPFPIEKIQPRHGQPITANLHVMGASGATAYIGLYDLAKPRVGDVLLVSAAAGTVGALVCQLGRQSGCRVIGIAGSDAKCRYLTDELGIEGAINYRTEDVAKRLQSLCPHGIDIYFDNVGGETLDIALGNIAQGARVVLCGATSQYEGDAEWRGPKNYFNLVYREATMQGFYIFNYAHRFKDAYRRLGELINSGQLVYREDVLDGIEQVPDALVRVLAGENFGTQLVKLGE